MKLNLNTTTQNQITAFDANSISINHQPVTCSVIVSAEAVHSPWFEQPWQDLNAASLDCLLTSQPEVILLGTGDKHRFIHPKHLQAFVNQHIAVECMSTAAACRTFNILIGEGRKVVAALLLEKNLQP